MAALPSLPTGLVSTEAESTLRETEESVEYTYPVAETVDDVRAAYADAGEKLGKEFDADEILVSLFNSAQRASASNLVLGAMRSGESVEDAIEAARTTLVHTGRVGGGGGSRGKVTAGLNKTRQAEFGAEFARRTAEKGGMLTKAEIEDLSREFGLDPSN